MAGRQGIFNMFKSLKFRITITAFLIISVIMSVSAWRDIKKTERVLLEVRMEKAALLSERIAHGIMTLMLNKSVYPIYSLIPLLVMLASVLQVRLQD